MPVELMDKTIKLLVRKFLEKETYYDILEEENDAEIIQEEFRPNKIYVR